MSSPIQRLLDFYQPGETILAQGSMLLDMQIKFTHDAMDASVVVPDLYYMAVKSNKPGDWSGVGLSKSLATAVRLFNYFAPKRYLVDPADYGIISPPQDCGITTGEESA